MFAKDKISQSMIDAVKQVQEATQLEESLVDKYLSAMGWEPSHLDRQAKAAHARTDKFRKWKKMQMLKREEVEQLEEGPFSNGQLKPSQSFRDAANKIPSKATVITKGADGKPVTKKMVKPAGSSEYKEVKKEETELDEAMFPGTPEYEKKFPKKPESKHDSKKISTGTVYTKKPEKSKSTEKDDVEESVQVKSFRDRLVEGAYEELVEAELQEVLSKDASAGAWIHDFVHSNNPKFEGKSKAKRKKMALAAYYAKQRNEEVEQLDELSPNTLMSYMKKGHDEMYPPSENFRGVKRDHKRFRGMMRAGEKYDAKFQAAPKKKTNEEVETVEEGFRSKYEADRAADNAKRNKAAAERPKNVHPVKDKSKDPDIEEIKSSDGKYVVGHRLKKKVDEEFEQVVEQDKSTDSPVEGNKQLIFGSRQRKSVATIRDKMKEPGKPENIPFDGPYSKNPGTVVDKSGAQHTPASKAKDLAHRFLQKRK